MAYRRRHGMSRGLTLEEEMGKSVPPPPPPPPPPPSDHSSSSLAAKAIRASSAHRDFSLSSAYGHSALSPSSSPSPSPSSHPPTSSSPSLKDSTTYEYTSMKSLNESKYGFWGVLARKAKAILDDDNVSQQFETPGRPGPQVLDTATRGQYNNPYHSPESRQRTDSPTLQRGLDAITSSLNYIGGTIGNAVEEGLTIVENRTADIIQETRKLHIRKKGSSSEAQNQATNISSTRQQPLMQAQMQPQIQRDQETQLKASRDVAMAMAAKAKLLLRELKTVKADLAFAKERCAQLEQENKILRESREKGDNPEDDDLIRLQLETLLAEKARLANENSIFARENRFLREIVEYHQLTMQDVVYLDEGIEEVTEVYPIKVPTVTNLQSIPSTPPPTTPPPLPGAPHDTGPQVTQDVSPIPVPSSELVDVFQSATPLSSYIHIPVAEDSERHSIPSA